MASYLLRNLSRSRCFNSGIKRWSHSENKIAIFDPFSKSKNKDKQTYLALVKVFETRDIRRRGHVEFIYAALAQMKEFGVHKDLEAYKTVLEVLPKGRFIPTNLFQSEFMHYPKQQQCAIDLLDQMEQNGVMPDKETQDILLNIFGRRGYPLRKYWRMMYWMPKFKNLSPWYLPDQLPHDSLDLAKMAIARITSVDPDVRIDVLKTEEVEESLDKTWIVNAQSPMQRILLSEQPSEEALIVRGPYRVHLRDQIVSYFTLIGKIRPERSSHDFDDDDVSDIKVPPSLPGAPGTLNLPAAKCTVHEQDDGTIVAVCATGTSSRDSLLSWIRLLERNGNPKLEKLPVIFTLIAPTDDVTVVETQVETTEDKQKRQEN